VEVLRDGRVLSRAYPVVGLPDAWLIYEYEQKLARLESARGAGGPFATDRLIYDGLGIYKERLHFLNWLNGYTGLKTLRTENLHDWLASHHE
jgi:hypothetical protein